MGSLSFTTTGVWSVVRSSGVCTAERSVAQVLAMLPVVEGVEAVCRSWEVSPAAWQSTSARSCTLTCSHIQRELFRRKIHSIDVAAV